LKVNPTFRRYLLSPSSGSKNKPSKKPAWQADLAICSSETSIDFKRTTWRYIPEDSALHNHRCENLKSYITGCYNCGLLVCNAVYFGRWLSTLKMESAGSFKTLVDYTPVCMASHPRKLQSKCSQRGETQYSGITGPVILDDPNFAVVLSNY
jgi:hypothetical protein